MKIIASFLIIAGGFLFKFFDTQKPVSPIIDRATVGTVDVQKGIIRQMGKQDVYMIECAAKHLKLNVVNLPQEYKEADLPVLFSGNIKLTHPLEDEDGDYFEVTSIH